MQILDRVRLFARSYHGAQKALAEASGLTEMKINRIVNGGDKTKLSSAEVTKLEVGLDSLSGGSLAEQKAALAKEHAGRMLDGLGLKGLSAVDISNALTALSELGGLSEPTFDPVSGQSALERLTAIMTRAKR